MKIILKISGMVVVMGMLCLGGISVGDKTVYGQVEKIAQNSGSGFPRNTGSGEPTSFPTIENPIKADSIHELVADLIDAAFQIGAVFAVIMIIYTGFKFVLARGNESEVTKAKTMFFWTVIGIAVLFGSKVIAEIVQATIENLQ